MEDAPSTRIDVERNRRVLLDAAASALSRDPDASLGEVAKMAGLTRATLYRHFESREKLLGALRNDALDSAKKAVAAAETEDGSALEALHRVIIAMTSLGGRFWPLLMDGSKLDPEFLRGREQAFAPVLAIVRRGQDSGQFETDLPPEWVVTALMAVLTAAVGQARGAANTDMAERVFKTIACGLASRPTTIKLDTDV